MISWGKTSISSPAHWQPRSTQSLPGHLLTALAGHFLHVPTCIGRASAGCTNLSQSLPSASIPFSTASWMIGRVRRKHLPPLPRTSSSFFHPYLNPVSYTHLRAHETRHDLVCRLLL